MKTKAEVLAMAVELEALLNDKRAMLSGDQRHDMAIKLNAYLDVLEENSLI